MAGSSSASASLFDPLTIGTLNLRNRIMLPPHGAAIGDLFYSPLETAKAVVAYWQSRAQDGAAWIDGITGFIDNTVMVPGFVPTGLGATTVGVYRMPNFQERARMYGDAIHEAGAVATCQFVLQGGMPHGPSTKLANYANNTVPHELTPDEIKWFIDEYAFSARQVKEAGLDGVELHANHEDLLQLFMSPATNVRTDDYGGSREKRLRFVTDILAAIRAETGRDFTLGVRFNMDEMFEGGYDLSEGIEIAKLIEQTGHVNYLHGVIGNNWGAPSYIQPHNYGLAEWAEMAGRFKQALKIPVVYAGRVSTAKTAEDIIAKGYADVVGVARAMFADEHFVSKAKAGRRDAIRPCIGCNDCLHAVVVDGMPFGCSVNPRTGRENEPPLPHATASKKALVVGAGPAGMELAALLAEQGHEVALWEKDTKLGGQMRIAAEARENKAYGDFIAFQERRLEQAGVRLERGREATADAVLAEGAEIVAIATGAAPRRPDVPGADLPFVVEGRDVMAGDAETGKRVALIAMEDHMQPLTMAGFLTDQGKDVQVICQTPSIAPTIGKYSIGAPLAKITAGGGRFRVMERVVDIRQGHLATRNIYSGAPGEVTDFDTVVLACGGEPNSALYKELQGMVPTLHILGDAYAPRRIWFATRQAYMLAQQLV